MGRFDNYQEYLKYVNPNSQQGRQVNKYTGGNYNPYGFSAATGGYEAISNTVDSPIDMTQYMQQPDLMTDLSGSLSTASTANKILGTKIGGKSIASKIAPNMGKTAGSTLGNPFTSNVSNASNFTGTTLSTSPTGPYPIGTEASLTAGQMAGNYFQNIGAGSVSAGLPTYLVGRAVRSAFDDDDPTTFTGGEMLGAGISGVGGGSAIAGMLGVTGPAGWAIGLGISLLGGLFKKKKAKKAKAEYDKKVAERKLEIKDIYNTAITDSRADREKKANEDRYNEMAGAYSNPYGSYDEGGLTPKEKSKVASMGRNGDTQLAHINDVEADLLKLFGGAGTVNPKTGLKEYHWKFSAKHMRKHAQQALSSILDPIGDTIVGAGNVATDVVTTGVDAVEDIGGAALDASVDLLETASEPVFEVMDAVGETVIEPVVENIVKPALNTGFDFVEAGIDAGREVASMATDVISDGFDFAMNMTQDVLEVPMNIMETGINFIEDAFSSDYDVPDLPPIDFALEDPIIQDPNIQSVDPYTGKPIAKGAQRVNFASGSMGFIGPEMEMDDQYTSQQTTI
tara:strand:- start:2180 stop:3880 length:1701 start_codon:yes stop_codon:yes gene_type:complete